MKRSTGVAALVLAAATPLAAQQTRLAVSFATEEAEAALAILETRDTGAVPADSLWSALFGAEGYVRLKAREHSLSRSLDDSTFRAFLQSDAMRGRADALRRTLDRWTRADLAAAAVRAFRYLPENATIRARVYPVIKPSPNSFVFEPRTDPAIFLYLDPAVTAVKLENIVAHELHHIGYASVCPAPAQEGADPRAAALGWLGALAEGRAVLAAAGSAAAHPHEASDAAERALWDRDVVNIDRDLRRIEAFLLDVLTGKLEGGEEQRRGMSFFATAEVPQGPFYTVGWQMAAIVERELGRERLVASLCDPLQFLRDYAAAAARHTARSGVQLPRWSEPLLEALAPDS